MIGIVGTRVGNVVKDFFTIETVPIGHGETADRTKSTFGVDVETFALAAAHVEGKLAGDCEGVTDLGFAGTELAKEFGHRTGFDATCEKSVELSGAGGDGDEFGAALVHFCGSGEAHGDEL